MAWGEVRGGRETVSHEPVIVLRIITRPAATSRFATNFFSTRQFFADVENGQLPTYSFIERQIIGWNHNDMHPPFGGCCARPRRRKAPRLRPLTSTRHPR
jgi:phospholipase C